MSDRGGCLDYLTLVPQTLVPLSAGVVEGPGFLRGCEAAKYMHSGVEDWSLIPNENDMVSLSEYLKCLEHAYPAGQYPCIGELGDVLHQASTVPQVGDLHHFGLVMDITLVSLLNGDQESIGCSWLSDEIKRDKLKILTQQNVNINITEH